MASGILVTHRQSEASFNLISEKCDILSILRDHPENRIYQRKIQELSKRFTAIRKTKGDGNCFYRALGYSYLESLLGKSREILKQVALGAFSKTHCKENTKKRCPIVLDDLS
ncbi:Ubiquitin thioesterase OTUB2, partial [Eschrichtius robustus]|nr:Ubiquitin thioesterase OTUB2 [Eschrichtius robustus]